MTWFSILPLIILGLLLVVLEIFILPGIISGVVGGILVVFGIYQSYVIYGPFAGTMTLFATIVAFALIMFLFFRSGTWKKIALSDVVDGKTNVINPEIKVGDIGTTISRLAPIGKAIINNEYFEVRTNGEYLSENNKISVTKIENNNIYVRGIEES